jgi:hypothetical protein
MAIVRNSVSSSTKISNHVGVFGYFSRHSNASLRLKVFRIFPCYAGLPDFVLMILESHLSTSPYPSGLQTPAAAVN